MLCSKTINTIKSKHKYVLAFVVNSSIELSPFKWMIPLAKMFQERNFYVLFILGPDAHSKRDKCEWGNILVLNSPADIKNLTWIDFFVCLDYEAYEYPLESHVIAFAHGFLQVNNYSEICYYLYHMAFFDIVALPCHMRYVENDLQNYFTGFFPPQALYRATKYFFLLECGPPSFGALQKKINPSSTLDSIIFAPHYTDAPWMPGYTHKRIITHHLKIVQALCENFKNLHIIYRPYPKELSDNVHIKYFLYKLKKFTNFILDDSLDYTYYFQRSFTLITDISTIARNFSFSAMRPTIRFLDTINNQEKKLLHRLEYEYFCCDIEGLLITTSNIIENPTLRNSYAKNISYKLKKFTILPEEGILENFVNNIVKYCNNNISEQFIKIQRNCKQLHPIVNIARLWTISSDYAIHLSLTSLIRWSESCRLYQIFYLDYIFINRQHHLTKDDNILIAKILGRFNIELNNFADNIYIYI